MWKQHFISTLNYHIVFCTKYRLRFLWDKKDFCIKILKETSNKYWFIFKDIVIEEDHIHLFVSSSPKYSPELIVKLLKQHLAYSLVQQFEEIKEKYLWWSKQVFSHWYFISSIWELSKNTIENYLKHNDWNE